MKHGLNSLLTLSTTASASCPIILAYDRLNLHAYRCPRMSSILDARRHILWGDLLNRTYGAHKKLYTSLFLPTMFGLINNGPP